MDVKNCQCTFKNLLRTPPLYSSINGASIPPIIKSKNSFKHPSSGELQFNSSSMHHHHQGSYRMIIQSPSVESMWTKQDHSLFLSALVNTPEDISGRWEKIADAVPGKTAEEVKAFHDALEHEVNEIEAGRVELPVYLDDYAVKVSSEFKKGSGCELGAGRISFGAEIISGCSISTRAEKGRKKGTPWSVDEHRKFLEGLMIYGKGDWRTISRNVVHTRTASQIASHAQKYFIRQEEKKEKKRSSIHDITTADITTTTDTVMVVNAESTPPATIVYSGEPLQSISFNGGVGVGLQSSVIAPLPAPEISFSGDDGALQLQSSSVTTPAPVPESNLCGSEGNGALQVALAPIPVSFCAGELGEVLPPTDLYGEGEIGAFWSTPFMTTINFYGGGATSPPLLMDDDDGYLQNLINHPFF